MRPLFSNSMLSHKLLPNPVHVSLEKYIPPVYTAFMTTAKIFPTGRSQAVRLPKEFRLKGKEVFIARMGAAIVLMPQNQAWDVLFDACGAGSQDFMEDREQPPVQKRSLAI